MCLLVCTEQRIDFEDFHPEQPPLDSRGNIQPVCIHSACVRAARVRAWCASVVCVRGVRVWCACVVCVRGVRVWYACVVCVCGVRVWCACVVCVCGMCVVYVYGVCNNTHRTHTHAHGSL